MFCGNEESKLAELSDATELFIFAFTKNNSV